MATAETRTGLIGLSVAMLGQAPGTDRLNEWVEAVDGGMSLSDLANHIADSEGFQATYPAFLTNGEFAGDFLGNVLGDNVSDALMTAAAAVVEGLLNDGMSRGELALAVVGALHDIAGAGADHPAYADLGMAAMAFANQVAVASHYTLEARMADPSADALAGVTADADSVAMAIEAIDAGPGSAAAGQTFVLTPTIDDFTGGDGDDTFVAAPERGDSNLFSQVLNPFDSIDGGGGSDTIHISGVDPDETLVLGAEDISNVENVLIRHVGAINANMSDWEGIEMVNLDRFGRESDVTVEVDGAMVNAGQVFGGDVTIAGASGAVNIEAGGGSAVVIGSGDHTASVTVKGGASVTIGKNAGGGGQSATVTSVSATGVAHNAGTAEEQASGTFAPLTDTNGFLTNQNGSALISITTGSTDGTGGTTVNQVGLDGVTLTNAFSGDAITGVYSWDHDGDKAPSDVAADPDATPPVTAATGPLSVTAELKFDVNSGGVAFGKITAITGFTVDDDDSVFVNDTDAAFTIKSNAIDGDRVPVSTAFTSAPIGKEDAAPETVMTGGGPTLTVNSDSIADLTLASTTATILVHNNSMTADEKNMPEDLAITLNKYGTSKVTGKLCVAGAGSAENIMLTVSGDSWVDLNSNAVKMLDIDADAKLSLSVSKFDADGMPDGASETLAGVTVSGEGAVSMNSLAGMKKLASIDASGSSGKNSFMSDAELAALTMVMGGSGNDSVSLVADEDGKLESIDTGDGNDSVSISGDYREDGLMVDLGDGDDSFDGNAGNDMSRVDGGDGRDTLKLSADGATYENADEKVVSIYSNFEVLDAGGGSGKYNVGRLGVDSIEIGESTGTDGVELDNVGAGTALSVSSSRSGAGVAASTDAEVEYNLSDDVTSVGSLIGGSSNSILNVSLMAMGDKGDSKAKQSGEASLTLTADSNLRGVIIDSNAGVHGTAAGKGTTSGHYENTVTVSESSIQEVKITGNAKTNLSGAGLASLEYVTAAESGGGVTVDASANSTSKVTLIGSQADDVLTAGDFAQTLIDRNTLLGNGGDDMLTAGAGGGALVGGAGGDMLTGAGGTDLFVYNAASESQLSFKKGEDDDGNTTYTAEGYDTISEFTSATDKLHLSKALHAVVTAGQIVGTDAISNGVKAATEWAGWMNVDTDGDPNTTGAGTTTSTTSIDGDANEGVDGGDPADGGAADLRSFIGNGKGLFLTSATSTGTFGSITTTYKNSIAMISQTTAGDQGTWLLFDIDGDGDFSLADDMVIFLSGAAPVTFAAATDLSM